MRKTICFFLLPSTEPLPPENLQIKNGATSVRLKWTDPIADHKIKHSFRVIYSNEAHTIESFLTKEREANVLSLQPGTEYAFSVYTVVESNVKTLESTPVKIIQRTSALFLFFFIIFYNPAEKTRLEHPV